MSLALPIREARPASTAWNVCKTLLLMVPLWGVFFVALPLLCSLVEPALGLAPWRFTALPWQVVGVVLFVAASALHLVSNLVLALHGQGTPFYLDAPRRLVVAGPYRHLRNPMAVAGFLQAIGAGLFLGSPLALVYAVLLLLVENYALRPAEEADLERRFGEDARRYRRRVRCWRPRLHGYDPAQESAEPPLAVERTTPPGRYVVLYDGYCKFCTAGARQLAALARPGALEMVSFQVPGVLDQFPGVSHEACMQRMYLIAPKGHVFGGFEAAVQAVATRPVVGWVAYGYYVPGVRLLFDLVYALVAANRYRLMGKAVAAGECHDGTCALHFPPRAGRG